MPAELWKHGWCSYASLTNTISAAFEHKCEGGEPIELNYYSQEDMDWAAEEVTASLETLLDMVGWSWGAYEMVR